MQKIMFSDRYGLTQAVLEGRKTMTRRIITDVKVIQYLLEIEEDGTLNDADPDVQCIIDYKAKFKVGKYVAVAESYRNAGFHRETPVGNRQMWNTPGWTNKMFVKAFSMRKFIQITKVRIERLQDISDEDCLKEGIQSFATPNGDLYVAGGIRPSEQDIENIRCGRVTVADICKYGTAQDAFAVLIDKISGKGTWDSNPFVFVYEFELFK